MPRTMTERQERSLRKRAEYGASALPGILFLELDAERKISQELTLALEALLDISPFAAGGTDGNIHRLAETAVAKYHGVGLETVRVCAINTLPEANKSGDAPSGAGVGE